jgi:hypothetical protein
MERLAFECSILCYADLIRFEALEHARSEDSHRHTMRCWSTRHERPGDADLSGTFKLADYTLSEIAIARAAPYLSAGLTKGDSP